MLLSLPAIPPDAVVSLSKLATRFGYSLTMIDHAVRVGRLERVVRAGEECYRTVPVQNSLATWR